MQRIGKMLLALAVVFLVFGGTNAFATSRGCSLSNAKRAESLDCTVNFRTNTYKVTVNNSPNSQSTILKVGLNEWSTAIHDYSYRWVYDVSKYQKPTTSRYLDYRYGKWAKLRLTAGSSKATGTGIISNEF